MTIFEFADIIDKDILVTRFANQDERWCAYFKGCEVKGDSVLIGEHGNGKTPMVALSEYVAKIRGKIIVFNSLRGNRMEYSVPKSITSIP
jgi:hypothetical protein